MIILWRVLLVSMLTASATPAASAQEGGLAPNEWCPVQSTEHASDEHFTVYRGRIIRFCCESCIDEFLGDPEAYLSRLPPLEKLPVASRAAHTTERTAVATIAAIEDGRILRGFPKWLSKPANFAWCMLEYHAIGWVLVALAFLVWTANRRSGVAARGLEKLFASAPFLALAIMALASARTAARVEDVEANLIAEAESCRSDRIELQRWRDMERVHYATFYDYGDPPRPWRMKRPPKLHGTYYRGNDERSPALFNNGYYRTTTFEVSLLGGARQLLHGDSVRGVPVRVRLEIIRAPNTPDFFWTRAKMARVYMTRSSLPFQGGADGPVADRVGLTELEQGHRWEGVYPLDDLPVTGRRTYSRVLYLAVEQWVDGKLLGGKFHFAIELDLRLDDGKLLPESDLWMNSVYRGKKFAEFQIPDSEWFSETPIPVKPDPGTQDPAALGISDYEEP